MCRNYKPRIAGALTLFIVANLHGDEVPVGAPASASSATVQAQPRPRPPYRVWFQPNLISKAPGLYRNMTLDGGGNVDVLVQEKLRKSGLAWIYGINHPDADGPGYWVEQCRPKLRTFGRGFAREVKAGEPMFLLSGVAVDEWSNARHKDAEKWAAEGLRLARKENPDLFVAIWITDPTETVMQLAKDGTANLLIIEGYTHAPARLGVGEWTISWDGCLHRCEAIKTAGLLEKTIFCFGHITDEPDRNGRKLAPDKLEEMIREIRRRYAQMPGVAFYQSTPDTHDTLELRKLVDLCDTLSGELWSAAESTRGVKK